MYDFHREETFHYLTKFKKRTGVTTVQCEYIAYETMSYLIRRRSFMQRARTALFVHGERGVGYKTNIAGPVIIRLFW